MPSTAKGPAQRRRSRLSLISQPNLPAQISIALIGLMFLQGVWIGHNIIASTDCRQKPFNTAADKHPAIELDMQEQLSPSTVNATVFTWNTRKYGSHLPLSPFYPPFEEYIGPLQRVFDKWDRPFPCVLTDKFISRTPIERGFIYMKEFKTGSSTLTSVAMRISRNQARKKLNQTLDSYNSSIVCESRFLHSRARTFRDRIVNESYLWSVIREPAARAISKFYHFGVSRAKIPPTLENMLDYFRDTHQRAYDREYYVKSLSVQGKFNPLNPAKFEMHVKGILNDYNFIGISERMDESLVVLQMLLGLDTGDILYLSSKASGSFEWWATVNQCVHMRKAYVSPGMREWFHSQEWKDYIYADVLLYKAVNRSLDWTIETLGRHKVDLQLKRFHWAQREAFRQCASSTKFACSVDGERYPENDCIWDDSGCGLDCLDMFAERLPHLDAFRALPV